MHKQNVNTESSKNKIGTRENHQSVGKLAPKSVSFTDVNCAQVTVPADQVAMYVTIKSDQLACLNRLIADKTAGFKVDLSDIDVSSLASLANDLAHATNLLVVAVAQDDCLRMKGGA